MKQLAVPAIAVLMALSFSVVGRADDAPGPNDTLRLEEKSRRLHEEAEAIRLAADARHAEEKKACWQKFLVNACIEDATRAMQNEKIRANGLDREARTIERDLKRRDVAGREARRAGKDANRAEP